VVDLNQTFYSELKPQEGTAELAEATATHGLSTVYLSEEGEEPTEALTEFAQYCDGLKKRYTRVRPAAWPSSFDAPFIAWAGHRYLGENPLGQSTFDVPSYAMGLLKCTDRRRLRHEMDKAGYEKPENVQKHNALADAIEQGETLAWLLNYGHDHRGD
jgi:hypothetical protein